MSAWAVLISWLKQGWRIRIATATEDRAVTAMLEAALQQEAPFPSQTPACPRGWPSEACQ